MSPELVLGNRYAHCWDFEEVCYGLHAQRGQAADTYHLVFNRQDGEERLAVVVGREGGLLRTEHFALGLYGYRFADEDGRISGDGYALLSLLATLFTLKDHEALEMRADPGTSLKALAAEVSREAPESFNLAIETPCGQDCVFCSLLEMRPPKDEGERTLAQARRDLVQARAEGCIGVRINGVDPQRFSRWFDLLKLVQELGFEKVDLFGTGRAFADEAFARGTLKRLPTEYRISIPLYGADAAAHEAVTRAPGSLAEASAGLRNLLALAERDRLHIETVVTRQSLRGLPALVEWARELDVALSVHLPYPMSGSATDRYDTCAPTVSAVAAALSQAGALGSLLDAHPCIALKAAASRPGTFDVLGLRRHPALAGAAYAEGEAIATTGDEEATVATAPCPHAADCVLAPYCPRSMYRKYIDRHGWEEFSPVDLKTLAETLRNTPESKST